MHNIENDIVANIIEKANHIGFSDKPIDLWNSLVGKVTHNDT